ncbi:aspartyl/asparaginyl beta-hydroxylase domain-containing protein [Sorangium sp. So ce136]|uniref:aspartyl/asparaginyl beta-hydroxylase domain-containing protein n=1 Tax=Sorangium sp. So ce136 TaxID=3133284 RepID=UPI003F0F2D59
MPKYTSQLGAIPRDVIDGMLEDVERADIPWTENYSRYQSGGWKTAALYNASGDSQENGLADCAPIPTEVVSRLPRVRDFIEGSGLKLMWVRLLRLDPNAFLWEHTDYGAHNLSRVPRLRLHVPLKTNQDALTVLPSRSVHMKSGFLWKLSPHETRHGACNRGSEERIHLILDCYMNATLEELVAREHLQPDAVRDKPRLSEERFAELCRDADALMSSGRQSAAEDLFRKVFHTDDLGALSSYDLLARYFEGRGDAARRDHWLSQKITFLNLNVPGHPFYQPAIA